MLTCLTSTRHSSHFHFPCLVCVKQTVHMTLVELVFLVEVRLIFLIGLSGERCLRSGER